MLTGVQITTVDEAKQFYPLFGLGANVALIFSGRAVKYFSNVRPLPSLFFNPLLAPDQDFLSGACAAGACPESCEGKSRLSSECGAES